MGIENRGQFNSHIVILQKDNRLCQASPQVQEERDLVLWAEGEGCLDVLTKSQRPVIEERYLSQQGIIVSFGLIAQKSQENDARITRAALHFANRAGITKLVRVSKGEEPIKRKRKSVDIGKMKEMLNEGRRRKEVAKELDCSVPTLRKLIRRYGHALGL